jgi:hypothetical protein
LAPYASDSTSSILPPFFILLGVILPTLLFSLIVIPLMSGPVIFEPIPLLSQELDWLAVLYELLNQQSHGDTPLGKMSSLLMEITILTLIPLRRVT